MAIARAAPSSPFLGRVPFHLGKSSSAHFTHNSVCIFKVKALFWGSRRSVQPAEKVLSLEQFTLSGEDSQGDTGTSEKIYISVVSSISEISPDEWDSCSLDAVGCQQLNPFLSHGFLSSLEESGSAVEGTGWMPQHIIAEDESNSILGVVPLYLKSYGLSYYPKLQSSVPVTPVTGPRILVRNTSHRDQVFDILVSAMKDLAVKFNVSSLHITFPTANEWHKLEEKGFLQRIGMQYHWKNHNYKNFDEFLMDMKQSKRKNIRQERKKIAAQNVTMKRLRGYEIKVGYCLFNERFFSSYGCKDG